MKNLKIYNKYWLDGQITSPLVIIIGGAAGTGKTVLAYKLQKDIPYLNYLTAALIRSLLTIYISNKQNPYLHKHTFELHKFNNDEEHNKKELIRKFVLQSRPIMDGIQAFLKFISTEKQHYIVDGPNAIPTVWKFNPGELILVEFVLKVSDENIHRIMMGGPTHNRNVTDEKLKASRLINEYLSQEGERLGKKVIEYNTDYRDVMNHIDQKVGEFLKQYHPELINS